MSPELEIFRRSPTGKPKSKHPLVFVHGAYTGAWCWNEHFLTWFADRGFETVAFSLAEVAAANCAALHPLTIMSKTLKRLSRPLARSPC